MHEGDKGIVAIDGPSGVGKSTISRKLAARLGFTYLDTGAMYRAVALYFMRRGVDLNQKEEVVEALRAIDITLLAARSEDDDVRVLLNGEEIGDKIRTADVSMNASTISALPAVREKLTALQRRAAAGGGVVAEGRDMGTVVFPLARFKFYLDATPETRAGRRARQLRERGDAVDEKKLLEMTIARDNQDSGRDLAPLKKADDAVLIDTSNLTIEEVLAQILEVIRK